MTKEIEPNWRIPEGAGRQRGIGIIGCGGIVSGAHLPAYRDAGLNVVAVYDVDPEKARAVAAEFEIATVAESVEALLEMPGVDIVDIAVPPVGAAGDRAGRRRCGQAHALPEAAWRWTTRPRSRRSKRPRPPASCWRSTTRCAGMLAVAASRDLIERGAIGRVAEAQIQVSVATPWHLWPWLASAPQLEVMYHSIHYQDSLRSILGDPVWVTSVHGRYPSRTR